MSKLHSIKPGLKKARKAANMTQQQLADSFGYSLKTVQNWEQGLVTPDLEDVIKLADLLSCDIDALTGRIDCPTHELQFIHDVTGLSVDAINKLTTVKDSAAPRLLSGIITDRRFMMLISEIYKLTTPATGEFTKAVIAHIVNDAPYVDSPDDVRAARQFSMTRILTNIVDDLQ